MTDRHRQFSLIKGSHPERDRCTWSAVLSLRVEVLRVGSIYGVYSAIASGGTHRVTEWDEWLEWVARLSSASWTVVKNSG
jgi:hypothetical protein